jgi:hypothetical protein
MNSHCESVTGRLLASQLARLRQDFHECDNDELFRMYLRYMVECRTEEFLRLVSEPDIMVG